MFILVLSLTDRSIINFMPRTQKQFDKIRENRKAQIMEVALRLFSQEGYSHVTIASLAKQAGISKGLMYNYFESKEELLKEVIKYTLSEILAYIDLDHDGELSCEEFELFIRKTFRLMRENREFYRQFFGLIIQPNVIEYFKNDMLEGFMKNSFELGYGFLIKQGFEDPMLELLNIAVIIEGLGAIMIFYEGIAEFPDEIFTKLENRIINTYTKKNENN